MRCLSPLTVHPQKINGIHTQNKTHSVPCGVCSICKENRVKDWKFRLAIQELHSINTDFITLTYDEKHVVNVWSDYNNNTTLTLYPHDLTLFIKQLRNIAKRKYNHQYKIKYYACGEYGETHMRPHYHLILFNLPTDIATKTNLLWEAWGKGKIDIQDQAKQGSFSYVAGYMNKGNPLHHEDVRIKPFSRSSQALGSQYITPQTKKWHQACLLTRNYVILPYTKIKQRMPEYYKQKIYTPNQRQILAKHWEINTDIESVIQEQQPDFFKRQKEQKLYQDIKFNHKSKHKRNVDNQ